MSYVIGGPEQTERVPISLGSSAFISVLSIKTRKPRRRAVEIICLCQYSIRHDMTLTFDL